MTNKKTPSLRLVSELLTTPQVRRAIRLLEDDDLAQRTLAGWQSQGIAVPSGRWDRIRGSAHACLWTLDDLARVRLIVRLRRGAGLSMPRVRALLREYEPELRAMLRPDSSMVLVVDRRLGVRFREADREFDPEAKQYRLPLASMYDDTARVLAKIQREAA